MLSNAVPFQSTVSLGMHRSNLSQWWACRRPYKTSTMHMLHPPLLLCSLSQLLLLKIQPVPAHTTQATSMVEYAEAAKALRACMQHRVPKPGAGCAHILPQVTKGAGKAVQQKGKTLMRNCCVQTSQQHRSTLVMA